MNWEDYLLPQLWYDDSDKDSLLTTWFTAANKYSQHIIMI